jgi:hypothetical protein
MKSFQVADFNAPLKEVDQPTPAPQGTQVLIRVKAAGVCHSDLHIWEGGYDLGHGRKPLSLKDRGVSLPRTMGQTSRSATSRWSIPGSAAASARPASTATRTCASSSRTRSASIATAVTPTT